MCAPNAGANYSNRVLQTCRALPKLFPNHTKKTRQVVELTERFRNYHHHKKKRKKERCRADTRQQKLERQLTRPDPDLISCPVRSLRTWSGFLRADFNTLLVSRGAQPPNLPTSPPPAKKGTQSSQRAVTKQKNLNTKDCCYSHEYDD